MSIKNEKATASSDFLKHLTYFKVRTHLILCLFIFSSKMLVIMASNSTFFVRDVIFQTFEIFKDVKDNLT